MVGEVGGVEVALFVGEVVEYHQPALDFLVAGSFFQLAPDSFNTPNTVQLLVAYVPTTPTNAFFLGENKFIVPWRLVFYCKSNGFCDT